MCMALHATAILSTSQACNDIPAELIQATPTTTPSQPTSVVSKPQPQVSAIKSSEGQKVIRLTPCPGNKYFRLFVVELLKMFDRDNKTLLDKKGNFIVRYACTCTCVCNKLRLLVHISCLTQTALYTPTHTLPHTHVLCT